MLVRSLPFASGVCGTSSYMKQFCFGGLRAWRLPQTLVFGNRQIMTLPWRHLRLTCDYLGYYFCWAMFTQHLGMVQMGSGIFLASPNWSAGLQMNFLYMTLTLVATFQGGVKILSFDFSKFMQKYSYSILIQLRTFFSHSLSVKKKDSHQKCGISLRPFKRMQD